MRPCSYPVAGVPVPCAHSSAPQPIACSGLDKVIRIQPAVLVQCARPVLSAPPPRCTCTVEGPAGPIKFGNSVAVVRPSHMPCGQGWKVASIPAMDTRAHHFRGVLKSQGSLEVCSPQQPQRCVVQVPPTMSSVRSCAGAPALAPVIAGAPVVGATEFLAATSTPPVNLFSTEVAKGSASIGAAAGVTSNSTPPADLASTDDAHECAICLGTGDDTHLVHVLRCGHIFCRSCLSKYVSTQVQRNRTVQCPNCLQEFPAHEMIACFANKELEDLLQEANIGSSLSEEEEQFACCCGGMPQALSSLRLGC